MNNDTPARAPLPTTAAAQTHGSRRAPRTLTTLSVAAIGALTLSACGPDDGADAPDAGGDDSTVTVGPEDSEGGDDQTDETAEQTEETEAAQGDDAGEDDSTQDASDEDNAGQDDSGDAGGEDEAVYEAASAVLDEYPDGVITEFDDEGGYYEFTIIDGDVEWEIDVDAESFEIRETEEDDVDGDDREEAEAVEIEFAEALRTAADEGGAEADEAELDTEDGTVVYEIELTNDVDVYLDVATGEVVSTS